MRITFLTRLATCQSSPPRKQQQLFTNPKTAPTTYRHVRIRNYFSLAPSVEDPSLPKTFRIWRGKKNYFLKCDSNTSTFFLKLPRSSIRPNMRTRFPWLKIEHTHECMQILPESRKGKINRTQIVKSKKKPSKSHLENYKSKQNIIINQQERNFFFIFFLYKWNNYC